MCKLKVVNKAGDVVADGVTPETFMTFKRAHGKGSAVIVELHCGEEILVDTANFEASAQTSHIQCTLASAGGEAT